MNRAIRKNLWIYNHGNKRLVPGSLTCSILDTLYPANKKTFSDLCRVTGRDVRTTMCALKKRNLVMQDNDRGAYGLTDLGMWSAICCKLKVSFSELCVLACACCVQHRYARSGKIGFYMRSAFDAILSEYYSKHYISWIFSSLRRKGFAVKYVKKTLRVYPNTCNDLMVQYGQQFEKLESWLDELEEKKLDILSKSLEGVEFALTN